jgi:2-polyprenyl-3-methyl-5-hydroxy-6-metoxy-1,4-benzoquinol methylase
MKPGIAWSEAGAAAPMPPPADPRCACCGGTRWRRHAYTATLDYLQCRDCHYNLLSSRGEDDPQARFEAAQAAFYGDDSLVLSSGFAALEAQITQRRLDLVGRRLAPGSSIVEAGPGSGEFLLSMARRGHTTVAVEHSESLARRLRERGLPTVMVGDFAGQPLQRAAFDAYCSFHVIEHVVDFKAHLRAAHACVKPNGLAFIATPNTRGWEHRLPFSLSPNYDIAHFQLFSPDSMRLALRDTGWQLEQVVTPSYAITWLRVITKVLRRLRRQDESATGGQYARSAGTTLARAVALFSLASAPLRILQEALHGGNEVFVVARRTSAPQTAGSSD